MLVTRDIIGRVIDPRNPSLAWSGLDLRRIHFRYSYNREWELSAFGGYHDPRARNGTVRVRRDAEFWEEDVRVIWTRVLLLYPTEDVNELFVQTALMLAWMLEDGERLPMDVAERFLERYPLPDGIIGLEDIGHIGVSVPDLIRRS